MPFALPDFGSGELDPTSPGRRLRDLAQTMDKDPLAFANAVKADPRVASYLAGPDGKGANPELSAGIGGFFASGINGKNPSALAGGVVLYTVPGAAPFVAAYQVLPPGIKKKIDDLLQQGINVAQRYAQAWGQGIADPLGLMSGGLGSGGLSFFSNPSLTNFAGLLGAVTPWGWFASVLEAGLGAIGFGPDWGDILPDLKNVAQEFLDALVPGVFRVDDLSLGGGVDVDTIMDIMNDQNANALAGVIKKAQITVSSQVNLPVADMVALYQYVSGSSGGVVMGAANDPMINGLVTGGQYVIDFAAARVWRSR